MPARRPQQRNASAEELSQLVGRLKSDSKPTNANTANSPSRFTWICAKCGREFDGKSAAADRPPQRRQPPQYPPNCSNWENLCVYCHDDEHSRLILAEYLNGKS